MTAGERCLIVTDTGADQGIVEALATVLGELGAPVGVASCAPVDLPGDAPPDAVGRAMLDADVVFELTSVFAGSSRARREACAAGARYLTVPGLTWTTLRPGGPFAVDFDALGDRARRIAERIDAARRVPARRVPAAPICAAASPAGGAGRSGAWPTGRAATRRRPTSRSGPARWRGPPRASW